MLLGGPLFQDQQKGVFDPPQGSSPSEAGQANGCSGVWCAAMSRTNESMEKKKIIQTATYPWKLCKKRGTRRAFPTAEVPAPIAKRRPSPGAPSRGTAVLLSVRAPHSFHWPWRKFLSTWIKGLQFSYLMPGGTSPSPRWRPVIKLLLPCRPSPQYCQANI